MRKETYERGFIQVIDAIRRKFDDALEHKIGFLQLTTDYRRPRGKNAV